MALLMVTFTYIFQVETVHSEIIENEVLAIIPTTDFVQMVYNFKQVMLH